jgi:hypothetical protein
MGTKDGYWEKNNMTELRQCPFKNQRTRKAVSNAVRWGLGYLTTIFQDTGNVSFNAIRAEWCKNSEKLPKDYKGTGWEGVDWTDVAQDRDKFRAVVNAVMNMQVQ